MYEPMPRLLRWHDDPTGDMKTLAKLQQINHRTGLGYNCTPLRTLFNYLPMKDSWCDTQISWLFLIYKGVLTPQKPLMHHGKFQRFSKFIHYWYRGCKSTPSVQVKPYWIDYWNLCYFNDLIDQFECTYEVLTVPACRWRPVMRRPVMLTDLIKQNTILAYDRSRSPDKWINLINKIDQF